MKNLKALKIPILAVLLSALSGCKAADPKLTDLFQKNSSGFRVSTKQNLAMAGGTAMSGAIKVKFSMGNTGAPAQTQSAVASGAYKVRASVAGVAREE